MKFLDKHVYWPNERSVVQKMFSKLHSKAFNSTKLFKWLGKKSDTYLKNISININTKNGRGETLFHFAAEYKNSKPLSYIINKCENLNETDMHGETPLHRASLKGNVESAKLLLEWGAEVDALSVRHESPLMYACKGKQNIDMIQLLIKHKANINLVNVEGETPLDICRNTNAAAKIINLVHPIYRQLM